MGILDKLERKLYKKRVPMAVTIEVTKRCNLDCIHCYVDHEDLDVELSIEDFKGVVDQLYDLGVIVIVLSGGELFYKKGIWELMEYVRFKKMGLKIITAATLLNKSDADRLKDLGILEVGISIYSHKAEVHDFITRKEGSFKKTLEMATYLREIGVLVVSKTLIMNLNYKDIIDVYNMSVERGIIPQFDMSISDAQNDARDPKQFSLTSEQIVELYQNKEVREILYNTKSFEDTYCKPKYEYQDEDERCNIGRTAMWINAKGEVFPCIQFQYPVGDLKIDSLKDIWYNNPKIDKVLEMAKYKNYKACHNCEAVKYCSPCIALTVRENRTDCNTTNHKEAFAIKKVFEELDAKKENLDLSSLSDYLTK